MLTIIIPSYKDPLLHKTIDSLLSNCEGDIEIIPIIDGYKLKKPIIKDMRVKPIYQKNTGMRGAINAGVKKAKGEYLMRTDEHCIFGKGYDRIILETIKDNWIVVPRQYQLDVEKWEIMDIPPIDYQKLIVLKKPKKFSGHKWLDRTEERKDVMIDETMAMQGSCWFMKKSWWDKVIVELQSEGYGTHYQDSVEMIFKIWQAGGKLMLNKNTWFAHKHRSFPRTHNYGGQEAIDCFNYSLEVWNDYYQKIIKPKWKI